MPSRTLALLCLVALAGPARGEDSAPAKIDVSGLPRQASLGQAELAAPGGPP